MEDPGELYLLHQLSLHLWSEENCFYTLRVDDLILG